MIKIFKSAEDRILEEKIYEEVAQEIAEGKLKAGLWAKALAQTDGDEQQARSTYIRLRFQNIIDMEAVQREYADRSSRMAEENQRKKDENKREEERRERERNLVEELRFRKKEAEKKLNEKGYIVKSYGAYATDLRFSVHYNDGRKSWFWGTKVRDLINLSELEAFAKVAK